MAHAQAIAAIDLCVVPPLNFERLFAFLMPGHGRRKLLWFEVTRHPTAEREAMGIRDRPISPGSPWQNPYVERLIGTVRRECLDQMLNFRKGHHYRRRLPTATFDKSLQHLIERSWLFKHREMSCLRDECKFGPRDSGGKCFGLAWRCNDVLVTNDDERRNRHRLQ